MTREQIAALMSSMHRAWKDRDAAGLAAAHAEDSIVNSPMFGEVRGRADIERSYRDLFRAFADWTFEPQDLLIDGARAVQIFGVTATHTSEMFGVAATHRKFRIQGVLIFELREGRIVSERRLYDFTGLLVQVGVLKARLG
jgi:steroid delta-isomerase-like uncharacterized protein